MRRRATCLLMWLLLIVGGLPGCLVLQVGVSNPAPNLPQVAVAPFVNLSAERSVDGRRFAEAYFTELQKVPGFQVIRLAHSPLLPVAQARTRQWRWPAAPLRHLPWV